MRPRSLNVFRSRCLIVLLAAFPATIGHASGSGLLPRTAATSKAEFCAQARDDNYFRELGMEHRNHIGFVNPLGPLLVGECWWHARLQRSALYLAVFRPELPKPDRKEARAIIDRLARNEEVVEIPGFSDFQQFAHEHEGKLRNYLARWELRDIFRNKYYKKANRPWKMSADDFKFAMDELHESVALRHRVTLLTLRYRGPLWTIHGVLVLDVQKTDTGYSWDFIDSNEPLEVHHQDYHYGQTHIKTSSGTGVPYLQMNEDLDVYPGLIEKYCGH